MYMINNRVPAFHHEVWCVVVRWSIAKGKAVLPEMFSHAIISNVDVLLSSIVDSIHYNIDWIGILCHNRFGDSTRNSGECIKVWDYMTECISGKKYLRHEARHLNVLHVLHNSAPASCCFATPFPRHVVVQGNPLSWSFICDVLRPLPPFPRPTLVSFPSSPLRPNFSAITFLPVFTFCFVLCFSW